MSQNSNAQVYYCFSLPKIHNSQYKAFPMVNLGLLACKQSFSTAICIVKLIEILVSIFMLIGVFAILVIRLRKQRRLNFYVVVSISMLLTLIFIIAYSFDGDIPIFNFLYLYFYNAYFSIIVFKLALKILQKYKQSLYYKSYRFSIMIGFSIYAGLVLAVLAYKIIDQDKKQLPFLIANTINLTFAIVFLGMGITHIRWQQLKVGQNMTNSEQNNPLPRFRVWILLNCLGQLMVLIQAVIFEIKGCTFTENQFTNQIINLIFVFTSFHMGMLSTVYFFLHNAPDVKSKGMIRKTSNTTSDNNPRVEIQLAYHQTDDIRIKMISQ